MSARSHVTCAHARRHCDPPTLRCRLLRRSLVPCCCAAMTPTRGCGYRPYHPGRWIRRASRYSGCCHHCGDHQAKSHRRHCLHRLCCGACAPCPASAVATRESGRRAATRGCHSTAAACRRRGVGGPSAAAPAPQSRRRWWPPAEHAPPQRTVPPSCARHPRRRQARRRGDPVGRCLVPHGRLNHHHQHHRRFQHHRCHRCHPYRDEKQPGAPMQAPRSAACPRCWTGRSRGG